MNSTSSLEPAKPNQNIQCEVCVCVCICLYVYVYIYMCIYVIIKGINHNMFIISMINKGVVLGRTVVVVVVVVVGVVVGVVVVVVVGYVFVMCLL